MPLSELHCLTADKSFAGLSNHLRTCPEQSMILKRSEREGCVGQIADVRLLQTDLHELQEGAVVAGIVNCLMYNHGVQVDLGAQYDG